ncbi:MAG TPA: ABC transporter permease [Bryobacteraceae bacterium]|jgi:putative ABC transport system permease protein|nr:ABC transporter permease [Bryobacteraceae bacterium]
MTWWSRLWRRSKLERDLARELQFHIAERVSDLKGTGLSEDEARRQLRQEFGGIEQVKEECRDTRGTRWIENLYRDIRFAFRSLSRTLGFSLLAVAVLTLGIGATTAMFSITNTVLLKPLAYRNPGRLVTILFRVPQFSNTLSTIPVNAPHYELWRDHNRTLEEISMIAPDAHILSGHGEAVQVNGVRVSPNLFHLLGIQPAIGRGFIKGEDQAGRERVVVISYRLWQEEFGGRSNALGQTLVLDGQPSEVVGVMPASFPFPRGKQLSELAILPEHADYWVPLVFSKDDLADPLGNENYIPIARLKPDVTTAQVLADVSALERIISKRYAEPVKFDPVVRPLQQAMARDVRLPLLVLMAAVAAVLLIVCINLTNLMLVRAIAQRREWAIRVAIGARTSDLLRSAFVESLCLSTAGGTLGCFLAIWLVKLVQLRAPIDLPRINELAVDGPVLLLALALSITSAFVFGLWPAWRAAQVDPQEALQSASRTTGEGRRGHRSGKLLVAAEVALSTVLLLTAGLLMRSFAAVLAVNPGMKVQNLLTLRINLPPDRYQQGKDIASFYKRLSDQVGLLPGVKAAGLISDLPLTGENNNNPATAGDRPTPPVTQWQMTNYRSASKTYFQAAGIQLKEGRPFDERDGDTTEVMISENLAEQLWHGQSAVGRPLRIYSYKRLMSVVGVVSATYAASLTQQPTMMVYFPDWRRQDLNMSLVVRTANKPASISGAVRRIVHGLEPQAAVPSIRTMRQVVASSVSEQRFQVILLAAFAAIAAVLACLGIYGVLAFTISRRTSEIGVRMALGARPDKILRSTLRAGMAPALVGIVAGFSISAALARVIANLLFGVRALDPWTYAGTSLILVIIAALACLIPARRAAQLNPIEALRNE